MIVAFLGPLPLSRHPRSRPFTPLFGAAQVNAWDARGHSLESADVDDAGRGYDAVRRPRSWQSQHAGRRDGRHAEDGPHLYPGHRPAPVVALPGVAAELDDAVERRRALDALGDRAQAQALRQLDRRPDDRLVVVVDGHVRDERAV